MAIILRTIGVISVMALLGMPAAVVARDLPSGASAVGFLADDSGDGPMFDNGTDDGDEGLPPNPGAQQPSEDDTQQEAAGPPPPEGCPYDPKVPDLEI
jgi:hypothetical protein